MQFAIIQLCENFEIKLCGDFYSIANAQALAGPRQRAPVRFRCSAHQIDIHGDICPRRIARRANAFERSWNYPRVVKHEMVACRQIARQVSDIGVFQPSIAMHDKQARCILRLRRAQRDVRLRKIEIKG